jgi:hypothetical protein
MSLEEIDIGEDLVEFLTDCHARKLVIDNCPGFGDEVLKAIMKPSESVQRRCRCPLPVDNPYWMRHLDCDLSPREISCCCATYVEDLSILDCRGFSISALKQSRALSYAHMSSSRMKG